MSTSGAKPARLLPARAAQAPGPDKPLKYPWLLREHTMKRWIKITGRQRRRRLIRKKVVGTKERPRLSVYRSIKNMYAQVIDDMSGRTIASLSTASKDVKDKAGKDCGNIKGSALLGSALAEACRKQGVSKVVFDRSGYLYHGRVKALADAARKGGLQF